MRPWILIGSVVLAISGTSYGIYRWTVSEAIEEGRVTAEHRMSERAEKEHAAARLDTMTKLLSALEEKLDERPLDSMLVISAANVAYDLGKFDAAERYYRRYIDSVDRKSASARIDLGFVVFQQGRREEAADLLLAVIADDPRNQMAMYNLAYMLDQMGDAKASREMMVRCRDVDSTTKLGQTASALLQTTNH